MSDCADEYWPSASDLCNVLVGMTLQNKVCLADACHYLGCVGDSAGSSGTCTRYQDSVRKSKGHVRSMREFPLGRVMYYLKRWLPWAQRNAMRHVSFDPQLSP